MFNAIWISLLKVISLLALMTSTILGTDDRWSHPCNRVCIEGETKICHYEFSVEKVYSMSEDCGNCPEELEHCYSKNCIPLDGYTRSDGSRRIITAVNHHMPGSSIEVCMGDTFVVDVTNRLEDEATSVHWHGHHQKKTPFMDGVPFVTQCPIQPGETFRYTVKADDPGTLFWHSHTGVQRADGMYGAFIVRMPDKRNPHKHLYDEDLSEHVIIINDWTHRETKDKYHDHNKGKDDNKPDTILVNGRGRYYKGNERYTNTPLAVFKVQKGLKYRFRLINSGVMNCPVEMYIDKHNVTFIATDGYDVEPVKVDSSVSFIGERWDFVLNADQEVGNYWIRFTGLMDCDQRFTSVHQVAVLHYVGAPEKEPDEEVGYCLHPEHTMQLNPLNKRFKEPKTISVITLRSLKKYIDRDMLEKEPNFKMVIPYDFYFKNNPLLYTDDASFKRARRTGKDRRYTPQLNHITMKFPNVPMLSQHNDISKNVYCSSQDLAGCKERFCECAHVRDIPRNCTVELMLVDEGKEYRANHPFHLHGYAFHVVGMDRLGESTDVSDVEYLWKHRKAVMNLVDPPLKDTVTVPDGGYTILRFRASNPGYWLFHCHIEFHLEHGMAMVFKVGEHDEFPSLPEGFPTCPP